MQENNQLHFQEFIPYIVIIIIVILVKTFVFSPIRVNGESMEDTLHDDDIMILDEISYRFSEIERFDIVVIHYQDEYLIKRIIGLPGETVAYLDNQLYINGEKVEENFKHERTSDFNEIRVPENEYFVLGDNRINSTDSRIIGTISKKDIKGRTSFTIYPFSRFGKKE